MIHIVNIFHIVNLHCTLLNKSTEVDLGPPQHLSWGFL